jgi:hypothetical protein
MRPDPEVSQRDSQEAEAEIPAGIWARTVLTVSPFALLGILFLLDRFIRG